MKKKCLMLLSLFVLGASAISQTGLSQQPPLVMDTLYYGTIAWGPGRADPVRAYDKASCELIFNVYETLISPGAPVDYAGETWYVHEQYWEFSPNLAMNVPAREDITKEASSADVNLTAPAGSTWSDGSVCIGWVDDNATGSLDQNDVLYMAENDGSYRTWSVQVFSYGPPITVMLWRGRYAFQMRTDPVVSFVNGTGNIVDTFDVYDAEYSFKRGLVQDQSGSPMWMFYRLFFDQLNSYYWTNTTSYDLAHLINNSIEVSGNSLVMNVGMPFPDNAFKQILTQTWSSIVSREWCIAKGCWNGELFEDLNSDGVPDWFTTWRHISASPIQPVNVSNYAGTGPYRVTIIDQAGGLVVLQKNAIYWKGWPAPQRKAYLEYINIRYIADWATREEAFISCQLDVCDVPRFHPEILDPWGNPLYPEIKTIKNLSPRPQMEAILYTFELNPTSPAVFTGVLPTGIPLDFMKNVHVRNAFSYALNHSKYLDEVYLGEGIIRETPGVAGLFPDYYTKGPDPPWKFDYNLTAMEEELKLAIFTQGAETKSVWDWGGFKCSIYSTASYPFVSPAESIKDAFVSLSAASGKSFVIDIQTPSWSTFVNYMQTYMMPWWCIGWLADFMDASNWYRTYMHTYGDFSYFQKYISTTLGPRTGLNKDQLIDLAARTPDGPARAEMYADLDDIYLADNPSLPYVQALERWWCKYWVKGWSYNPTYLFSTYPSQYYYHLYKEDTCWADITGETIGVSDGVCNMRDIALVAGHFGARAPDTSMEPVYDPKWAPGTYGVAGYDVHPDRRVDMRDVSFACAHFMHSAEP